MINMAMTKQEVNEKMKELYVSGESLDEGVVKKKNRKMHKEILSVYGSWEKAKRASDITQRKLREREKFMLYSILKVRQEKYGEEATRPKNIHPEEFKERIVKVYKTIKAVKDIINNWNEDKVMYEMYTAFLTGSTIKEIKEGQHELYEHILDFYDSIDNALIQFNKRFGVPSLEKEQVMGGLIEGESKTNQEEQAIASGDNSGEEAEKVVDLNSKTKIVSGDTSSDQSGDNDLINMMIKLNYIDGKEEAEAIVKANQLSKGEVAAFLFNLLAEAQSEGVKVTENYVKEKDVSYFFAVKAYYGTLTNAFQEITNSLVDAQ
jgi:hypothetical protein